MCHCCLSFRATPACCIGFVLTFLSDRDIWSALPVFPCLPVPGHFLRPGGITLKPRSRLLLDSQPVLILSFARGDDLLITALLKENYAGGFPPASCCATPAALLRRFQVTWITGGPWTITFLTSLSPNPITVSHHVFLHPHSQHVTDRQHPQEDECIPPLSV